MGVYEDYSPSDEHPVNKVNWFDAVLFCNWLSRKEGLTPCYHRTGKTHTVKVGTDIYEYQEWRFVDTANGYRLPTEAEWEYACRAGTVTAYAFGEDAELLDKYAVVRSTQARVGGSKLPNGWGLFDMHGNMREWCYDWHGPYSRAKEVHDPTGPNEGVGRVMRGGSLNNLALVRSAYRIVLTPRGRIDYGGFRLARNDSAYAAPEASSE